MRSLGWGDEYNRVYRLLSKYSHADFTISELYKFRLSGEAASNHLLLGCGLRPCQAAGTGK